MARIVVVTSQVSGNVNASSELARRLQAANHEVTYVSPFEVTNLVATKGLDVRLIGPDPAGGAAHDHTRPGLLRRAASFISRLPEVRSIRERRAAKVDAWDLERFEGTLHELAPELILLDMELPMHVMSSCALGVPVAVWTPHMSLWKRPGVPPLDSYTMPGVGWRGRQAGIEWEWFSFRALRWLTMERQRITRFGEDQRSVIRTAADRTGFSLRTRVSLYQWFKPVVFRSLPLLILNAWELEFPHDPHPTSRYAGPMVRPLRQPNDSTADQRHDLQRLAELEEVLQHDRVRRMIYTSFGTWHRGDDRDFFRRIVSAVAERAEWHLVIGLGGRVTPSGLGSLPPNVHVFEFAPQLEALQLADCAINHAGINTVNECIQSGVPMLLYPFDFLDQPGTAARVVYHGLGVLGDRRADSPRTIERRIDQVLSDDAMRNRVVRMQKKFLAYDLENSAVKAVESLL